MNVNHKQMAGANEYPTLSVPSRWTQKRMINIAMEISTTASAEHMNLTKKTKVMVRSCWFILSYIDKKIRKGEKKKVVVTLV